MIKNAILIDKAAGSLVFGIGIEYFNDILTLIEILEQGKEFKVQDWGISNSTLEEVFMKVTNKKSTK